MGELTDVDHYRALGKLETRLKYLIESKSAPDDIKRLQSVIKTHKRLHKPPRYYYDCTPSAYRK